MDKGRTGIIEELRVFIEKVGKKYKIKKAILFGSAARGGAKKHSDLDIILVSDEFKGKSALKRPVPFYLEWNLRLPVDFLCYTSKEFEDLKKRATIVREAVKEGITVYG